MRRFAAPLLALVLLTGCSGEQGERAQELLTRAQTAQSRLTSMSYELRMTFAFEGQRGALVVDGGGYLKGRRAGDQALSVRMEGIPGAATFSTQMTLRRGQMTMNMNGRRISMTVPPASRRQYDFSSTMLELSRYVKQVRVRDGRVVNGEPGTTVAGVIDTEGLLKAVTKLSSISQATGAATPDLSKLMGNIGDTRAALFISSRTGLVRSAVVGLTVELGGKELRLEATYRLKDVNRAIAGL